MKQGDPSGHTSEEFVRSLASLIAGERDVAERSDLLRDLAVAQFARGEVEAARKSVSDAIDAARAAGSGPLLARAVLLLGAQSVGGIGTVDEHLVSLLEEALTILGDEDRPQRALLLARLAAELYWSDQQTRRAALAREAVGLARSLEDPAVLARCLHEYRVAGGSFDMFDHRIETASEIVELGSVGGEPEMVLEGRIWRILDLIEFGHIGDVAGEIHRFAADVDDFDQPTYRWYQPFFEGSMAELRGELTDAERLFSAAAEEASRHGDEVGEVYIAAHTLSIEVERGRAAEILPLLEDYADTYPDVFLWRAALAYVRWESGDHPGSAALLSEMAQDDFARARRGGPWLLGLAFLAEVAGAVHDHSAAQSLYELLRPFEARNAIGARTLLCRGSVARHLGILAAAQEQFRTAERHFGDAIARNQAWKQPGWLSQTKLDYAQMLVMMGRNKEAGALVRSAQRTAQRLGLHRMAFRAAEFEGENRQTRMPARERSGDTTRRSATRPPILDAGPRGGTPVHVTVLFSDIVGSTATAQGLGDAGWVALVEAHRSLLREEIAQHGGVEVGTQGDGFLIVFPDARVSVECAIRMQEAMRGLRETTGNDVHIRIGVHSGTAIKRGDDFFGLTVHTGARVTAQAGADEILITRSVGDQIGDGAFSFGDRRSVELKGIEGSHEVMLVLGRAEHSGRRDETAGRP